MRKIIISTILIFYSVVIFSQQHDVKTDSITYSEYLNGDWDNLIKDGKQAIRNDIDFKWLRQRLGYAWYVKENYYKSMYQYEQSLKFDTEDEISNLYLYYNGLNTGNAAYARYYASRLPQATKDYYKIKAFVPFNSIDFEGYNRNFVNYILRSSPNYYRMGIQSLLGYRLSLYQMISTFNQKIEYETIQLKQNEYYGLLTWTAAPKTYLSAGYHYINTGVTNETDTVNYPGNLFFGKVQQNFSHFDFSLSTSYFSNSYSKVSQTGMEIGVTLPGKMYPYLKSSVYYINDNETPRVIFQQNAGLFIIKNLWAEAQVTLGNENNFTDANGIYFFNPYDPITFKTGLSLSAHLSKNWIVFLNYTYSEKEVTETLYKYNQHSITEGIIWKF